jgi:hypothetical protein
MQGRRRRGTLATAMVLAGVLALTGTAMAGQDELKGGSVVIQLQNSRGLKLKPKSITMPITGGAVDPVDGSGDVQVKGGLKAKRGRAKAQVKITTLTLGANGGLGSVTVKVNKDFVSNFARLSGGTVARSGWGATISNVRATITGRGAKALNKAFFPKQGKGARKSARGRVKGGQPFGTIASITTDPRSVEVVPGSGELELTVDTGMSGTLFSKLDDHCIDPLMNGVVPIAPAETGPLPTIYHFPVSGGSVAPDFSAGELLTAGGQTITKNSTILTPGACTSNPPPTGSQLKSTDFGVAFDQNALRAIATLPSGTVLPRAPLGAIDFSTGTRSVDPSTKTVTITDATVSLADLAAPLLNQNFPNQSGTASEDFATGDAIGTITLTAELR